MAAPRTRIAAPPDVAAVGLWPYLHCARMDEVPPSDVGSRERQAAFDALQHKLSALWEVISGYTKVEQTIVVVPSLSMDRELLEWAGQAVPGGVSVYEERFLFLLLLLRQPRARMVFVSSMPISERVIGYYLSLMPGVIPEHARKRLFLVSAEDPSPWPLCEKILDRPDLVRRIREVVLDPNRAHIVPYVTTELERELALALGIPMYGSDPRFAAFGTKSGARQLFEEEGIPHPLGARDVRTVEDLIDAIAKLRSDAPGARALLVKHDQGGSGWGNAIVDVSDLPPPAAPGERDRIAERIFSMSPDRKDLGVDQYLFKLEAGGGVVEELVTAPEARSPSVQLRVTPLGDVEVLSTHDQLLGGPSGQTFMGCVFPADPDYAREITTAAKIIGKRLAKEGVIGRFALDFVVVRTQRGWDHYAIEINLRKGGTTHPYLTLQFLTDGRYDPESASFFAPGDRRRCLVATDHVHLGRDLSLGELFDIAVVNGLHFDNSRQTGVVFHMLGGLESFGLLGMTAVEETVENAMELFDRTAGLLGATDPPLIL